MTTVNPSIISDGRTESLKYEPDKKINAADGVIERLLYALDWITPINDFSEELLTKLTEFFEKYSNQYPAPVRLEAIALKIGLQCESHILTGVTTNTKIYKSGVYTETFDAIYSEIPKLSVSDLYLILSLWEWNDLQDCVFSCPEDIEAIKPNFDPDLVRSEGRLDKKDEFLNSFFDTINPEFNTPMIECCLTKEKQKEYFDRLRATLRRIVLVSYYLSIIAAKPISIVRNSKINFQFLVELKDYQQSMNRIAGEMDTLTNIMHLYTDNSSQIFKVLNLFSLHIVIINYAIDKLIDTLRSFCDGTVTPGNTMFNIDTQTIFSDKRTIATDG